MRVKLKNILDGRVKYITKAHDYPIKINDEIRFRRWHDNYDVWLVVDFWENRGG